MGHSLYRISKAILSIFKKHNEKIDNPSIKIYANEMQNRITFKIKAWYYFELLTPETMKLLEALKTK